MSDIFNEPLTEINVIYPALSQEKGLEIMREKLNELIVQFEILKNMVKGLII
jgi:hypothetical protein